MGTILGQEAFRKWVSASGIWADYVRPVPFVIEDEFVIGYGLDYAEEYRNLPYIGVVEFS